MYRAKKIKTADKKLFYRAVNHLLHNLVSDQPDWLPNLCNAAALLGDQLEQINWVGFYILQGEQLVLGPFQGKPACTHIALGSGVCGTAAEQKKTLVVPDVDQFPGHIACDSASASEIVVPMITADAQLLGVLDVDSPVRNRFDQADASGLEQFAAQLAVLPGWPRK